MDLFPVLTGEPTQREKVLASVSGLPVPVVITYSTWVELIEDIALNNGNGKGRSAIESALKGSSIYKDWQRGMPFLKDVPNIRAFRTQKKAKVDTNLVNSEIRQRGESFMIGQVLYSGGDFKSKKICVSNGPISTTVNPSVAWWHAKEINGEIGVLRICSEKIKGFAYSINKNQIHHGEFEVVLQNNITLNEIRRLNIGGIGVVEYEVK